MHTYVFGYEESMVAHQKCICLADISKLRMTHIFHAFWSFVAREYKKKSVI